MHLSSMFNRAFRAASIIVLFTLLSPSAVPQQPAFAPPENIAYRKADVMSEGVRLTAEIYSLKEPGSKPLPTIIMSHGWGGTAALLRQQALDFARAGYLVIAFDYRG